MDYKIYDTLQEYNSETADGTVLKCGILYYVKEDSSSHFRTNNIDGSDTIYDGGQIPEGYILPTGDISLTENASEVDVKQYATATVNVESPVELVDSYTLSYFDLKRYIKSVNIPSGVTSIGNGGFQEMHIITEVTIPSGVTSIGNQAFYGCDGMLSVNLPSGITSIGDRAFENCWVLPTITIPSTVTSLGNRVFYNTNSLTTFICNPTTPPTLGSNAFYDRNTNLIIYVPDASVEDYKSATNWSAYASNITGLSNLPTT